MPSLREKFLIDELKRARLRISKLERMHVLYLLFGIVGGFGAGVLVEMVL